MALGFLIRELARPGRVSSRSTLGGASLGLILGLGLVCGGCDTGSFVPPRPPELGGGEAGPVTAAGAAPGSAMPDGAPDRSPEPAPSIWFSLPVIRNEPTK